MSAKKKIKRVRRVERVQRQLNVDAPKGKVMHDSPVGETFRVPEALLEKLGIGYEGKIREDAAKERRKLGAHNTPMELAEQVVEKALFPHLTWMAQDPDGWDRAHRRPAPPPVYGPHQYAHQYPLDCGCYAHRYKRECPEHAAEVEAQDRRRDERAKEREAFRKDKIADPLLIALEAAVPIAIEDMRRLSPEMRIEIAHGLVDIVASRSDNLMYGSKKKGEVAEVFSAVARGLAACAFQPGGVTWCGIHWEAT